MNASLQIEKVVVQKTAIREEYYFIIKNTSEHDIFLDRYTMLEIGSLEELGLSAENCKCFRTGRHKNDMPTVFKFGTLDGCMKDAMGGMTESGDKTDVDATSEIVSDHLTILGDTGNYVVIAFATGRDQLFNTRIAVDKDGNFQKLVSEVEFEIRLKAGASCQTETIYIEKTADVADAIKRFADEKAARYGARNQAHPSVFCTWYYYGLSVTYEDVKMNLKEMREKSLPFDVFQLDEGWEVTLGEWKPNQKFPKTMKELAAEIKEAGYRPGIWTSPFVASETATMWQEHPDWKLCDKEGNPCLFPMNGTIYHVLDITNPGTWEYLYELYHMMTFEWGYTYHKLDFTRASVIYENAVYYDDTITLAQAYYQAVKAIRSGMGEDSYFLMCGGLYDPIIGLVDAQRTGSDVLSMWSSNINKDGKTAPYTIKQSVLRYYMNTWWNNDPDALMVRKNEVMDRGVRMSYGLLNDEEVKTSTVNQFMGGGIVCSTEPLDKIDDERLYQLIHIMPVLPTKLTPLGFMDCGRYPENMKVDMCGKNISCIARINWSDEEDMPLVFTLTEDMLPEGTCANDKFVVCDFYGDMYQKDVKVGDVVTMSTLKPHGATVIKIEKMTEKPMIVGSTGHYSMGAEISKLEIKDGMLHFVYQNPFDYPVKYKILLPGEYVTPRGKELVETQVGELARLDIRQKVIG